MALTDIETLKKIIQSLAIDIPNVMNERIVLTLFEDGQLQHSNIDENSESVKIIRQLLPAQDTNNPLTLNGNIAVNLDTQKPVWNSVVVADDLLLTTVYTENDDYVIDYVSGTVERTTVGSAITDGQAVYVWHIPYVVLVSGSDYNIDYDNGIIKRRAGTTIPNKATVYVDYSHSQATVTDSALTEIILEMEAFISPRLKSGFSLDSADEGLKGAATNYCMYLFCLSSSLKELHVAGKDNSDDLARRWNELADKYLNIAIMMFSKYLSVSSIQIGGIIQNRYTKSKQRTLYSPAVLSRQRRR